MTTEKPVTDMKLEASTATAIFSWDSRPMKATDTMFSAKFMNSLTTMGPASCAMLQQVHQSGGCGCQAGGGASRCPCPQALRDQGCKAAGSAHRHVS